VDLCVAVKPGGSAPPPSGPLTLLDSDILTVTGDTTICRADVAAELYACGPDDHGKAAWTRRWPSWSVTECSQAVPAIPDTTNGYVQNDADPAGRCSLTT